MKPMMQSIAITTAAESIIKIFGYDNEIHWKIFREINLTTASKVKPEIYSILYTEICVNGLVVGHCSLVGKWYKCINQF